MEQFDPSSLKKLYIPPEGSHKGNNGRLLIIGGSHLFHSASLWALKVASRIVDLVHYSSVKENNEIVRKLKEEFRDGIAVPRAEIESYIEEDDCILIGPGMVRTDNLTMKQFNNETMGLEQIEQLEDEGLQTYYLTKYLLQKYPNKKWVIDAGALQMLEPESIPSQAILTPHHGEFERLLSKTTKTRKRQDTSDGGPDSIGNSSEVEVSVQWFAKEYNCVVLHKGEVDYVSDGKKTVEVQGGNQGMTKGGTGDVLAGLTAALYTKNDAFLAASAASYINKKAGDDLFKTKGLWFNASDLADQIPQTMKRLLPT